MDEPSTAEKWALVITLLSSLATLAAEFYLFFTLYRVG